MKNKYMLYSFIVLASGLTMGLTMGWGEQAAQMALAYGCVGLLASLVPAVRIDGLTAADNDPVELVKGIEKAIANLTDKVKAQGEELTGKMAAGEKVTNDVKAQVDEALTELNLKFRDLEQKAATGGMGGPGGQKVKSVGEQFVESDGFKSFSGDQRTAVKATITTTLAGGSAGDGLMTPAYRDNDLVRIPRRVTVDDLIPAISISSSSVDFARQLTRNNAAAMVAEAGTKPYSDYSWESASVPVRTMAHLAKVTRQAWEDAPRLIGEINSELIYGLDLLREAQVLFGTGTGQNLHGIVPQATDFVMPTGAPAVADLTRIDVLRLAMLNLVLRGYRPDGHVLNTADWAFIELMKDGEQRYLVSSPFSGARPMLWGLPVLDTPAMTQGDFLTGAFRIGATYYRRSGIEVRLSTENDKDFEQNLGTLRAEERGAIAVKRPDAFEFGSFDDALTP